MVNACSGCSGSALKGLPLLVATAVLQRREGGHRGRGGRGRLSEGSRVPWTGRQQGVGCEGLFCEGSRVP